MWKRGKRGTWDMDTEQWLEKGDDTLRMKSLRKVTGYYCNDFESYHRLLCEIDSKPVICIVRER